ncbi:MAG: NADH-quinone oxidoreductase subunit NuoE [bacterium]|nr:NADH-quinone oxidoreductase subunit NuoE [bacterium]
MEREKTDKLQAVIDKYKGVKGALIPVLQEVQDLFNYLPDEALRAVGKGLKVPLSRIYGVVTFYTQFHLVPQGKNSIHVCTGTACHVKGAKKMLERIESLLGIKDGDTTEDFKFTLKSVRCVGTCFLAPVMMINEDYFGELTEKKTEEAIKQYN